MNLKHIIQRNFSNEVAGAIIIKRQNYRYFKQSYRIINRSKKNKKLMVHDIIRYVLSCIYVSFINYVFMKFALLVDEIIIKYVCVVFLFYET